MDEGAKNAGLLLLELCRRFGDHVSLRVHCPGVAEYTWSRRPGDPSHDVTSCVSLRGLHAAMVAVLADDISRWWSRPENPKNNSWMSRHETSDRYNTPVLSE